MNICGAVFDHNTGSGPCSINFMNQATRAGQNLITGCIWPAGRTWDMPGIWCYCFTLHALVWKSIEDIDSLSLRGKRAVAKAITVFIDWSSSSIKIDDKLPSIGTTLLYDRKGRKLDSLSDRKTIQSKYI